MRDIFDNDEYLEYLLAHCNDTDGGPVDRVGGATQIAHHLRWLELKEDSNALEIGCGTGRVMEIARTCFGTLMHGCDISHPALDYIRDYRPQFAHRIFALDTHGTGPVPDAWADAVLFWGCFELVPQRASLLETLRILKPGGLALLSSVKHRRPFADDADAQAALAAYAAKSFPIAVSDPTAFESFVLALGLKIEKRIVFERKAHLVQDRYDIDEGGERTFAEAFYLLRKPEGDNPLAQGFSHHFGNDVTCFGAA